METCQTNHVIDALNMTNDIKAAIRLYGCQASKVDQSYPMNFGKIQLIINIVIVTVSQAVICLT